MCGVFASTLGGAFFGAPGSFGTARSLKTLNSLAGYLVWSGRAWGGVGEAHKTRSKHSHLPIGNCGPEGVNKLLILRRVLACCAARATHDTVSCSFLFGTNTALRYVLFSLILFFNTLRLSRPSPAEAALGLLLLDERGLRVRGVHGLRQERDDAPQRLRAAPG